MWFSTWLIAIAEKNIAEQRVVVNAAAGATGSSTAFTKAVELTLQEGIDND